MRHFDIMRQLIEKTAPTIPFSFSMYCIPTETDDDECSMLVKGPDFTFTVLETSVWTDIKRILQKKMSTHDDRWTCDVCYEESAHRVSCNRCSNDICGECYIRAFRSGHGVVVCPWCRHRTGTHFPPAMIEIMTCRIRQSLCALESNK